MPKKLANISCMAQVRDWRLLGLPVDDVSVDNGILVTKGKRWPLMIDPQGQANAWVRNMEARAGLKLVKQSQANFLRVIEGAVRLGEPVLIEDVGETLDPALEPLLQKQVRLDKLACWQTANKRQSIMVLKSKCMPTEAKFVRRKSEPGGPLLSDTTIISKRAIYLHVIPYCCRGLPSAQSYTLSV